MIPPPEMYTTALAARPLITETPTVECLMVYQYDMTV